MKPEDAEKLARRFIALPLDKRRLFLQALAREGVEFSLLPIPAGVEGIGCAQPSYAQQRMGLLWLLDPQGAAYNLPGAVRLQGALELSALSAAFEALVARHEPLRTLFRLEEGVWYPSVQAPGPLALVRHDFAGKAERECLLHDCAREQAGLPFDLQAGPLLRVCLVRMAEDEHVLLLTLHHIVADGWSMNVLIEEFSRLYAQCVAGQVPQLPPLPIQYTDYALWQRSWLEAGELQRQLDYWTAQLGDEQPVLELPTDFARPVTPSYRGVRLEFAIDPALSAGLRALAQQQGVTLFMVLLASFQALLHRYTGQQDIRVGVPVAGRGKAETEGLIGLFVNTQVLRAQPRGDQSFSALLAEVRAAVLGAQAHQELPFERLVHALQPSRDTTHSPLFQVLYNHQPHVADLEQLHIADGLRASRLELGGRTTQFDLALDTLERSGTLHAALTYACDLFEQASIERLREHWLNLLHGIVQAPEARLGELPMLGAGERERMLHGWNATAQQYPGGPCVQRLIEAQAQRTPDAPALAFGNAQLSYAELNARANRLAHRLIEAGVGPEVLVGIAVERSLEMVVALLATLKAGGAYVPLDPDYPAERLAYMLEDSGVGLLLTQTALRARLPLSAELSTLCLDDAAADCAGYPHSDPVCRVSGHSLAYVIYTSGSTGRPKGAGNSHQALFNRLAWMQQAYRLEACDSVLQKTPFSFDVSVWEFFWPLMVGARLVVAPPGAHRDPAQLIQVITEQGISTLHFVPSMLQAFIHEPGVQACTSLRRIVCSGEALPAEAQAQVFARLPGAGLYNLYGPTEAAIDVTHWTCVEDGRHSVPIGQPIANLRTHILDAELNPVPPGAAGELYLGGVGLARGYHRRPALTAERFVADPFGSGERLYRTGDLARYREDGVIDYLGRLDHQVKLRGLRIELGEIEAGLLAHPVVKEAVVLAQDNKLLVAYLVPSAPVADSAAFQAQLRAHLQLSLPVFMVPECFMLLERLPVTANGKLDRKALPRAGAVRQQHEAPHSERQRALAQIWQQLLGVEQVGLDDNFFALGGDSIIAIQVVSRARQAGLRLSPADVFKHQTLRDLAQAVEQAPLLQIEQGPLQGEVVLTPIQHWFFEQAIPARQHWNQGLLLTPREPLHAERLEAALTRLVQQHDALRLRYRQAPSGWQQTHAESAPVQLWQRQADSAQALRALCDQAQASLDLAEGPLLRAMLVQMADGSQRLLLVAHHLVVDGVSWRVLLEDLQQAYRQQPLPAKTSGYQHWAARLGDYLPRARQQLPFWLAQRASAPLPQDNPSGRQVNASAATLTWRLSAERTRQLLQRAGQAYRTQVNDLLLTALAQAAGDWSGQSDCLVLLEGHGREALFDDIDLSRTVGWLTSLFPVRLSAAPTPGEAIKAVKEQLRAVPDKGVGYGVLRYLDPDAGAPLAALAPSGILFNYLGQFDQQFGDDALFAPAREGSGQAQDPLAPLASALSLEGQVYEGQLVLEWRYCRESFDAATVEGLTEGYGQALEALIDHCLAPGALGVTPSDFPLARLSQAQLDGLALDWAQIDNVLPLSPLQQGMLFHSLYEPQAGAYINQLQVHIEGLDVARFAASWQAAFARHDVLRSQYHWETLAQPVQSIAREVALPLQVLPGDGADLKGIADQERARGFALDRAPLLRLVLVHLGGERYQLIYTSHHILMDGWSNAQLLGEVLQRYAGGQPPASAASYADYLAWLQRRDHALDEAFWRDQLQALEAPTLLGDALPREADEVGYGELVHGLDEAFSQRLAAFARAHQVTVSVVFQAAWALLLQRYCNQTSVAFGATVAGRPAQLPGIEQQVGLFINTLPVICAPRATQRVDAWLAEVQALNLQLREHEHTSLVDIQRWAGQQGAVFDSLLVFENFPVAEVLRQGAPGGLRFSQVSNVEQTSYPLTLGIEQHRSLVLTFSHDRARLGSGQVAQLRDALVQLLAQFVEAPEQPLASLSLLDIQRQAERLALGGQPQLALDSPLLVHQRFERQVARTPQALALIAGEQRWTYAQLNAQANRLAHRLRECGVGPGQRVGLSVRRGPLMIASLLAVLKAGAAYVPLDPDYPAERLAYMCDDSALSLLLMQPGLLQAPAGLPCLLLEAGEGWLDGYSAENPVNLASAQDLAYLIYTSGSTGQPKGVSIAHAALREFCVIAADYSQLVAEDRVLQFATFSFDGFVEQCYPPLCVGACLVLRGDELWDTTTLYEQIIAQGITLADLPAAYWFLLAQEWAASAPRDAGRLRQVHVGGEAMSAEGLKLWHAAGLGHVRLLNTYGPTEATVVSSTHFCTLADGAGAIPIGRALPGRALHILDGHGHLAPAGLAGELCIAGGAGLARDYHGRAALTAERFVPDPFARTPGQRLYRSGDLARVRADGVVEYIGRADHQVKIRGFRVELGELEAHLQALPMIREAAVLVHEGATGKQLIGYAVPTEPAHSSAELTRAVRQALKAHLPDYLLPAQVVALAALPLNRNGKLDRKALPAPEALVATDREPLREGLEQQLGQIWQQVLGVEGLGREDNFFDLGGHSLLATQIVSQVRRQLGRAVSLRALFEHPQLCDFAAQVQASVDQAVAARPPMARRAGQGEQPLSFAQQRLWFLWSLEPHSSMYNMPGALRLRGPLDHDALRRTFEALLTRHEVLRSTYHEAAGGTWQRLRDDLPLALLHRDLRGLADAEASAQALAREEVAQPFDLANGPLLRVQVLQLADQDHVLLMTLHHIVADDASFRVLIDEFVSLYSAFVAGERPALPVPTLQYADFARWQRQWLEQGGELQRQLAWWQAHLGEHHEVLELPQDLTAEPGEAGQGATCHFTFDRAQSDALRQFARQRQQSLFSVLLAAFNVVLQQRTGQARLRIGTDIANRNHAELERMVGFFVNQLVLQVTLAPTMPAEQLLALCSRTLIEASEHQDLPFERLVEALRLPRRNGRSPLFSIKLIHQEGVGRLPSMGALEVSDFPSGRQAAELDLVAAFYNDDEHLHLSFEYPAGRFAQATLEAMFEQVRAVLAALVEGAATLDELSAEAERVWRECEQRQSSQRAARLKGLHPIRRRRSSAVE
ncbi:MULTISPECIES: non-ribosomal peptide synthetase [Pseudomonas putida group]|uniref:Linear gramicidin synthase subunit D n=1 Tax=Pseudomonas putida TaxID=303 RepID=A0A1B2F3L6_PSEPU|nr:MULTISPECIES: non-ribosomal peptide synthetase [Pseudomonas putida group]ANY86828.1 Linear gramicidin synthase subunit D [Pseudomonas putida]MCL8305260.1 non-ribosomal peptide synthetase [Pseudomonas putida]